MIMADNAARTWRVSKRVTTMPSTESSRTSHSERGPASTDALDRHFLGPSFRAGEHGATAPGLLWFSRAGDHVAKSGEEDEIPAASPSQSLLLCGARAPGSLRS